MTTLIDGDGLFYIIANNFKDVIPERDSIQECYRNTDRFVESIVTLTGSSHYAGFIGNLDRKCFRHGCYRYAIYKGNRPLESNEVATWKPFIRKRLEAHWNFKRVPMLEADDLISYMAWYLNYKFTIASPDKDLKQIPGLFYDYKTDKKTEVGNEEARLNFSLQLLMGDTSDNIAGIPGIGIVKAKKLLKDIEPILYKSEIMAIYCKYFGPYYGPIIFNETLDTVKLMEPLHRCFDLFKKPLTELSEDCVYEFKPASWPDIPAIFD